MPRMELNSNLYFLLTLFLAQFYFLGGQSTIESISEYSFNQFVTSNEYALVYFTTENCQECVKQETQLTLIKEYKFTKNLNIIKTDSEKVAKVYGVRKFPTLMYFRKALPIIYNANRIQADDVAIWLENNKKHSSSVLKDDTFEHLTQAATGATTGDWLVLFYRQEDGCRHLLAALETVTQYIKQRTNTARVNLAGSPQLKQRFDIKQCPTLISFRHGKQYTFDLPDTSTHALRVFAEGGYKNFNGIPVQPEPSPFDNLIESIMLKLEVIPKTYRPVVIIGGFFLFAAVLFLFLWLCSKPKRPKLE